MSPKFLRRVGVLLGALLIVGVQAFPAAAVTVLSTPLQVNFQTQTSATPTGYAADYGQAYDATRGYGWVDSSGTPLSLVGNGRQRNVNPDKRLDTLMQMKAQAGSGITTPGTWKASIANGTYSVTVAVGDPSYINSVDVLHINGQSAINFTPTSSVKQKTATVTATVTNGFLTVDATGGTNTKIDYITVNSIPTPPPTTVVAQINFQAQTSISPTGYSADYGQAYDATRGYGWVDGSGTPLSLVGNGRQRNVNTDKRLDTLMQMQAQAGSGITTPGTWKLAVANGSYSVTVAVGDPSYINSIDVLHVNGQSAINFTPTSAIKQKTATVTATVTNGFLTVDATGGMNTKIDYITVNSASTPPPTTTTTTTVPPTTTTTIPTTTTSTTIPATTTTTIPTTTTTSTTIPPATPGIISTLVGKGRLNPGSYEGDGSPNGVAVDSVGNIYVSDVVSNVIRKVDTHGNVTVIAGNGTEGFSGDGGPATSAQLGYTSGIAVDQAGNVYISDQYQNRVRKISTSGIITTFAGGGTPGYYDGDGGPATSGALSDPNGLAFDSAGNLYIADTYESLVRKVDTHGILSTVAGTPSGYGGGLGGYAGDGGPATSARLSYPTSVTVDSAGNLYITDAYVHTDDVRKVDTHGIITTVAGNQSQGFSGDGGSATNAQLDNPESIAVDSAGNLYIADFDNNRIRKVDTHGFISTVAGNGTAGTSGDGGPATSAEINHPNGIAVDAAGNLYIGDEFNNPIRKVTPAS